MKLDKYEEIILNKDSIVDRTGLTTSNLKVTRAVNTNFKQSIINFKMENTIKEILKRLKQIEDAASAGICSLEIEKEKLKLEVRSRSSVTSNEDINRSLL